jgi:zinc protease
MAHLLFINSDMVRRLLLTITLLLIATGAFAQKINLTDKLPQDPLVRTGTLPNGMRYYVRKNMKPEHRMELRLALKAGSVLEDDDQQGLAHFCEHMQFNGTKHFPKMDLVNFLEATGVRFGAHLNAYTSFDETVYMLQLPTDSASVMDKGLQVMQDWAGGASLDSDEIDKERGVVLEEWRLGRGANERVNKVHLPVEYANSQYAERLPIGKDNIIEHAPYEALRRFYHSWYRPDLMAIIAVGDFDIDKMEQELKSRFSSIQNPPNERTRTKYTVPMHSDLRVSIASDKELQFNSTQIVFQRPDEKEVTVSDYRDNLKKALYLGMLNARFQERLRKPETPLIFAGVNDSRDLGATREFGLFAALKPESVQEGIRTALEELIRVEEHGFTATELEREKKSVLRGYEEQYKERDKTESNRLLSEYVRNFLSDEPFPGIVYEKELAEQYIPAITLDEVNALTTGFLKTSGPTIMLSCQKNEKTKIPTEDDIRTIYKSVTSSSIAAYEDKVSNQPLMPSKPKPGKIVDEKSIPDLGITKWTLSNGATVIVKPTDFKNGEILFSAISPGGTSLVSDADELSASFAAGIVDESGVGAFDATALEKMLAGKVVSMSPSISTLSEGFNGRSSPQDLETMFQLLYLYATAPRADEAPYKANMQKTEAMLKTRGAAPESAFGDTLSVTMTQYNPRTRPMTVERLQEVSLDRVKQIYKDRFADFDDFTFFIVGNVDLTTLRPLVETYVASLPTSGRKESWKDLGIRPPKGDIAKSVYKGVEPKSRVSINITGPFEYTPKNRYVIQEMAEVLSIKLRETLREEKGGVYGVSVNASPIHYPVERYQLSIGFGCAPDRVNELVDEVMKKLDTMTMKAPEDIYLTKVKQIASKELEVNLKLNNYWMSNLSALTFNNEDLRVILARKQFIADLTANDILEAGKKYCNKANLVEVVLYPENGAKKN